MGAGGGRGEKWFEDSYATTTKALSALFRKKVYAALESSIAFWNEKSGWVDLVVKLVVKLVIKLVVNLRKPSRKK